jgi:hypothetical protein
MLNAIPDARNARYMSEIFLATNDELGCELRNEIEIEEKFAIHKVIGLGDRRKSCIGSSESESPSSAELSKRNSTVDMGKIFLFQFS